MQPADNPASTEQGHRPPSRRLLVLCILLVVVLALAVHRMFWVPSPKVVGELAKLHLADPQQRKQAAWDAIDHPDAAVATALARGLLGDEPDPDVRESFAYALGRIGNKRNMSALETACDSDSAGIVRAAAWLAIARIDADHFRTLAASAGPARSRWDAIGIAQGYLQVGDTRGVAELLAAATDGDHSQRIVAARALDRGLVPLMDSVGAWPIEAELVEGEYWPAELLAAVWARIDGLRLQRISDDLRQHRGQMARLRGNFGRILAARERIARFLFGRSRG